MFQPQGPVSPDLIALDDPEFVELAHAVRAGGADASSAYIRLLRRAREQSRHDLARTCLLLWPPGASAEALRELVLLYVDAGAVSELKPLLAKNPGAELTLPTMAISKLLDHQGPSSMKDPPRFNVWPNESLPYAAKTSIFHVQETIIARQKVLIDRLLSHMQRQRGTG